MSDRLARRAASLSVPLLLSLAVGALAQGNSLISGQNVNMVSGTEWPDGDPFLQRQNEPTIGVSTRNELHLMGGSNDYRTVDLPGLPEGRTTGDSWISSYFSYDGGGRWTSTLLPGYPQDTSAEGLASPLKTAVPGGYEASADPVIRPGTHGLFYYSGIAFTRSDNPPSAGFVATYMDLNNDERGDTIKYVRTTLFDQNDDGSSFIDKPWIAVDKPRGGGTRIIEVQTDNGPISQTVECGNLYVAYARIQGEGSAATSSQIMFSRSEDCGASFLEEPIELSSPGTINQGAYVAVDPSSGRVQVAWRQFENATLDCTRDEDFWRNDADAWPVDELEIGGITYQSGDAASLFPGDADKGGTPWLVLRQLLSAWLNGLSGADRNEIVDVMKEAEAWLVEFPPGSKPKKSDKQKGNELRKILRDYNQGKSGPGSCDDLLGDGTNGMLSGMNPNAIMVSHSDDFGETFSEPLAISGPNYFPFEQGTTEFSFRSTGYPTMTYDASGRSYVAWTTRGLAVPDFDEVGGDGRIVVTTSNDGVNWTFPLPIDEPEVPGHQLMPALEYSREQVFLLYYDFRADVSGVFDRFITDLPVDATTPRHSVDVRAAFADAADVPVFTDYTVLDNPSTQASRYPFLILSDENSNPVSRQTEYNPPNLPMFKGGLVPFFGDFIDLAALHFVRDDTGNWDFDTDPGNGPPVLHAVWTDNRDVVAPLDGDWTSYVPPGSDGSTSIFDPDQATPVCTPGTADIDRTRMRNQNIYTSRLTQGVALAVPGNNRPLGTIQRAFVAFLQNLTDTDKLYRIEILNQPVGGSASFDQFAPQTQTDEVVERNSSIARTIYVSSSDPSASVDVRVFEIDASGTPVSNGLTARTRINADPTAPSPEEGNILAEEVYTPAIFNPAIFNPAIFNPALLGTDNVGIYNPAIFNPAIFNNPEDAEFAQATLQQLALLNPAIFNPAIFNPAIFNPAIFNPAIFNPAIFNPAIFNPAIFNPAIFNVGVANPAIFNPAIFNPAIFNSSLVETSVVVENTGNATAAYSLNLDLESPPDGFLFQVMVYRTYTVPSVEGCELVETVLQEQLVSELTPDVSGSLLDPEAPTFYIPPADNVVVTVRVVPDPNAPVPGDPATIDQLDELNLSQSVAPQAVDTESVAQGETEPEPVVILAPSVPPLVIDATPPGNAATGIPYSSALSASGGNGTPVSWSLVPSSSLPPGLSLSTTGVISGVPTAAGAYAFDVRARDDVQVAEQAFSITVAGGPSGPVIDQQQPVLDTGAGTVIAIGGNSDQILAQVVTAGITGSLDEVRLAVACGSGDLVVQIQGVDDNGQPDGNVLASEIVPGTSLPSFGSNAPSLRPIAFASPASFNSGDQFAIVVDNPTGGCSTIPGPTGDSYVGGDGFFDSRPNPVGVWVALSPRRDLPFETVVSEVPLYTFAFDNVIGTVPGTVEGTIRFDFLSSPFDSGTGPASDIRITSTPAAIPPSQEGDIVTRWTTQAANTFTIVNGTIADYAFGAAEGVSPTVADNVMCLNNGPQFTVGGVYICTPNENYFGDASNFVYNTGGIGAVTFGLAGPGPIVNVPINYDEQVDGEIAGQYGLGPVFELGVGVNTVSGIGNGPVPDPAGSLFDFDVFSIRVPAGRSLTSITLDNWGTQDPTVLFMRIRPCAQPTSCAFQWSVVGGRDPVTGQQATPASIAADVAAIPLSFLEYTFNNSGSQIGQGVPYTWTFVVQ